MTDKAAPLMGAIFVTIGMYLTVIYIIRLIGGCYA